MKDDGYGAVSDLLDTRGTQNTPENLLLGQRSVLYSDQGWQYQMPYYQRRLKAMNIVQSMSRKGNCHDNSPIESFFNLMKCECLNRYKIDDFTDLRDLVNGYVD